jgi:Amt family ammonium transporter
VFKDQVSSTAFMLDLYALIAIVAVMLAAAGYAMIDVGAVRAKNAIDTVVSKIVAGVVAALAFIPIGYGIWNWQFDSAAGVHHPLSQAISDWWIGGRFLTSVPQSIDPKVLPNVDQYVLFYVLFVAFAFFVGVVVQSAVVERMKPLPTYILAGFAGGIVYPFALLFLWGSASPLTILGIHDDIGGLGVYIPLATVGVVAAWRLGPRRGKFDPVPGEEGPAPGNVPLIGLGLLIVLANLVMFAIAGGYQIPDVGYNGIAFTTSGQGLVATNLFCAICGGGLGGAVLAYRKRSAFWAIGGPFVGYVSVATFNDIGRGWYEFFVGFAAVYAGYGMSLLLTRWRVDEEKLGALVLGPGIFGAIAGGFLTWGTHLGGILGVTTGTYKYQAETITPWLQLLGVVVAVGGTALATFALCFLLERTIGLRVTEEQEISGLDAAYWGARPVAAEISEPVALSEEPVAPPTPV